MTERSEGRRGGAPVRTRSRPTERRRCAPPLVWVTLTACAGAVPVDGTAVAGVDAEPAVTRGRVAFVVPQARPHDVQSFRRAKRVALTDVYPDHHVDLYCACGFDDRRRLDAQACGYVPRRDTQLAHRVEWEHLVPAARFGRERPCWARGGRPRCRDVDPTFAAMEGDLHNLVPAVGELNNLRRDYDFDEVAGEPREFGRCDFELDRERHVAEPPDAARGDVARAYLYMAAAWGLALTADEEARFWAWHDADPPDDWERERDARIAAIQGNGNQVVRRIAVAPVP